ncbi:MAG: nuclear transport factor 2 family protein [Pseudomonadota bacterium]
MTLKEIADALVEGCKTGGEAENLDKLYAADAVSVEAVAQGEMGRETAGLEGIKGKHAWWDSNFTIHSAEVGGPFLHGEDRFAVTFKIDAEEKATGQRMPMEEVAIYQVADGKIVREEFFYTM